LTINQKDINVLSAIYAGPNANLNYVLHELIWHDWFSDTPISQLLPGDDSYGFLIVPGETPPWIRHYSGINYRRDLYQHAVQVCDPSVSFSLDTIPKYLAYDCARMMMTHETENGIHAWFSVRRGAVLDRQEIPWRRPSIDLSPGDYAILRGTTNTITRIAENRCNPANKW
jgi:hypothetical protein